MAADHSAHDHSPGSDPSMDMGHHDHSGHDMGSMNMGGMGHMAHMGNLKQLFWVSLALAVPVVAFSQMFAHIFGYTVPSWGRWVAAVLGTVMYVYGGRPFLTGAVSEIKARKPGMMLLISLGITVALVSSWCATLGLIDHSLEFWAELALLIVVMLLGHWIEMKSLAQTSSALDTLAALLPDEANLVEGDKIVQVPPSQLKVGDIVLVRPGASVPADGVVVDGTADMDESMVTGESRPIARTVGDKVIAGTVSTDSSLRVRVTAVGSDTTLASIDRMVAEAQSSKSNVQLLADKAAGLLFWFALIAAAITAVVWLALGQPDDAVARSVTVLVIACPHALGLAIPLVVSIATERAAKGGILIKDRAALETMRQVDVVLFDKTGTLTKGEPAVVAVQPAEGMTEDRVIALAAAAEADSEHPLAKAIVQAAQQRKLTVPQGSNYSSEPALGVTATVEGEEVRVGGPRLLEKVGQQPLADAQHWANEGAIVLHVLYDGKVAGALKLADEIRPESKEAVEALQRLGVEVVMITGDAQSVADDVAKELGIKRVFAQVLPGQKADKVAQLQGEGKKVAMVGDGVNDAPALARANVGIAIGAGTEVAAASAGVILVSSDPRSVVSVILLSRATYQKMIQNLWWAAGYNLVSVPLAAGVLAPIGFVLPMSVGALLMSLSTVVVALNAQTLRRLDLSPAASVNAVLKGGRGLDSRLAHEALPKEHASARHGDHH